MILTEDKEIIQKNLSKTLPEIVILLNKKYTKKEIKNYCDNHNLRYKHLSSHERSEIQKNKILTKQREQTPVNYNYFKVWSKNMAYIFGLLNIFKKEEFRKFSEFIYSDMDEKSLYLYRKRNRNTTIS